MDAFRDAFRAMTSIRKLREAKGLTQPQLADILGVTQATISRWENGERYPGRDDLRALADALDVRPADLIEAILEADLRPEVVEVEVIHGGSLKKLGFRSFRVLSDSLTLLGVKPGDVLLVNTNEHSPSDIESGSMVIVEAAGDNGTKVLILRQLIAPKLLTTNRLGTNLAVTLDNDVRDLRIVGLVVPE